MDIKTIMFSNFLPVVYSVCLSYMYLEKECPQQLHNASTYSGILPITECLDMCLRNGKIFCSLVKWKRANSQCFISSKGLDANGEPECITFSKAEYCRQTKDVNCFTPIISKGLIDESALGFDSLTTERECRSICLLDDKCTSYVWDTVEMYCRHQIKDKPHHPRLQIIGEIFKKKMTNCSAGRCANIRTHPGKPKNKFDVTDYKTLYVCVNTLRRQDRYAMHWDTERHVCHLFNDPIETASGATHLPSVIEVSESKECKDKPRRKVCEIRQRDSRMKGGLKLNLKEPECVGFCKLIVTCAAVDWDGSEGICIFHFLNTELVTQSGWTNHQVIPCSVKSDNRNVKDGLISAYYIRTSEETMNSRNTLRQRELSCIRCACWCIQLSCNGFACDETNGCVTGNVQNVMYEPVRFM